VTAEEKIGLIVGLMADSLSKARALSKIALDRRPELRSAAAEIMKTVKATRQRIEALAQIGQPNGRLDKSAVDRSLNRILKAARQINREVSELLDKARR
jgi:hypothetical protein